MKRVKVSICVPVYNMEKYLKECIETLINQTLKEIEIIFVNDGSTDKSEKILEEYKNKYSNIKVITQKNKGLGDARNTGLENAIGEYVGFVDADDFVEYNMYERMYDEAKKQEADIVMCDYKFYTNEDIKKKKWYKPYNGKIDGEFLNRNTQPWNKIVSNKLIKNSGFKFFKRNGDGVFIYLMLCANKIVSIDDKLYNYRVGHSSMSSNYNMEHFEISIESYEEQLKLLNRTKYKEELKEYFEFRKIYVLIQAIAVAAKTKEKAKYYKYVKELRKIDYKNNKYMKTILKKEFGVIKYIAMTYFLPINYSFSSRIIEIVL